MQKNDPARPTECKVLARVSLLMGTVKRGQEWRAGEIEGEILEARESCRKGEAQRLSEDSAQIPG